MKTDLAPQYANQPAYSEAADILSACVHCGFCTATCPTYLQLGDERDGPRGRIYLIKAVLEGEEVSAQTQTHLDRCLGCRSCETTCPSGVRYGHLLELGRNVVEQRVGRPWRQRLLRYGLRQLLPYRRRFGPLLWLGQRLRPLVPALLRQHLPRRQAPLPWPAKAAGQRLMLSLPGCAQASAAPNTDRAAAQVLARLGIELRPLPQTGCCGAVDLHLDAAAAARAKARANIDQIWPLLEAGAEALVMTASGCGAMVQDYGHLLKDDPQYAAKAQQVAAACRDLVEVLEAEDLSPLRPALGAKVAVHCPCSQQHAMGLPGRVKALLQGLGIKVAATANDHLCCGSAGTYSLLQPRLSQQLKAAKLADLQVDNPELIVTANIGCQLHLGGASKVPVKHWVELLR